MLTQIPITHECGISFLLSPRPFLFSLFYSPPQETDLCSFHQQNLFALWLLIVFSQWRVHRLERGGRGDYGSLFLASSPRRSSPVLCVISLNYYYSPAGLIYTILFFQFLVIVPSSHHFRLMCLNRSAADPEPLHYLPRFQHSAHTFVNGHFVSILSSDFQISVCPLFLIWTLHDITSKWN